MISILSCFKQVSIFFARVGAHTRTRVAIISAIFCLFSAPLTFAVAGPLDPKLQNALEKISDPKTQICLPAINALATAENPAAIPELAKAFKSEKRALVRRYIVDALGSIRHKDSLPTLKLALKDQDVQVRQSAVAALGLLGTPQAQALIEAHAASEKSPAVKTHVAHQLRLDPTPAAAEALDTLQWDNDESVQQAAEKAGKTRQKITGAR